MLTAFATHMKNNKASWGKLWELKGMFNVLMLKILNVFNVKKKKSNVTAHNNEKSEQKCVNQPVWDIGW